MSARQLLAAFDRWRSTRTPLVLATVVETAGSTYTKAGHRMLIAADGRWQGLVSGGCLEGDLAEHAGRVLADDRARVIDYDLRNDSDGVFGLGIGCDGLFRILLQPLRPRDGYDPFDRIAATMAGEQAVVMATVYESHAVDVPLGTTVTVDGRLPEGWLLASGGIPVGSATVTSGAGNMRALFATIRPLPRLLIVGAGPDAVPLASLAHDLDWRVTVADHRPGHLGRGDFAVGGTLLLEQPASLVQAPDLDRYSAAVVMSHHLDTDREALRVLARTRIPFVGLLGPVARRDRLLAELGDAAAPLLPRLHAPVGLDIAADTPAAIALAIVAQLQASRVRLSAGNHAGGSDQ
ncbi:MAG: XdhC family protein [Gammaproteobacteria bacterium]|nr:XdhC family protein [Gammaproteobacteria bacterium]